MQHRFFLLIALMCTLVPLAWAEGTPVMRFVPVAGDESEVALNTLQKVVFTQDSVSLNLGHETSGMMFIIALMKEFNAL